MNPYPKVDLHMHTTASDGTDTPAEILAHVKEAGINLFAITDHDTIDGCFEIRDLLKDGDPSFLFGVEFSCVDEEGKYHILGYGFDPESPKLKNLLTYCHDTRIRRVQQRLHFIEKEFGFTFSQKDIDALFALKNPGKPHMGNLMVKYGYTKTKEDAIYQYLNKFKGKEERVRPEYAVQAIAEAGGIPVLAHPSYGSGDETIVGIDMDNRLKKLVSYGLQGVEAFYSTFPKELRREMLNFAKKYDLYVTAGSDYHGKNKPLRLGETDLDDDYPEGLIRFLRDVKK